MEIIPPSEEELERQLKELTSNIKEMNRIISAMCYCPAPKPPNRINCELCRIEILLHSWEDRREDIKQIIGEIKALGYDTKIEFVCEDCAKKIAAIQKEQHILKSELFYIFYFKTKDQKGYHIAESDSVSDYKCVLEFLKNKAVEKMDHYDKMTIEKMTGITIDETDSPSA